MIHCRDVTKVYYSGSDKIVALNRLNFSVSAGDCVALVGRSGSGKSTLLHILSGMDRPTEGEVKIDGRNLATLSERELIQYRLREVGVVFQSFHLIAHRTAFENVELPLMLCGVPQIQRRAAVRDALARVGLSHRLQHRPNQLSGGEQQRVAIARATMNQPKILFADEPTGNLDSRTAEGILNLIREISAERGTTVLLITHDQTLAQNYANRRLSLVDGAIECAQGEAQVATADERSIK